MAMGSWEHVAVVIDADKSIIRLYRDRNLAGTNNNVDTFPVALGVTTQSRLGRFQYSGDPYFKAMLDDFRICNTVLSEGEVKFIS